MTQQLVWVPPPGWPPLPMGWQPSPGWQPDPAWPAPPPGWQFWQPAPTAAKRGFRAAPLGIRVLIVVGVLVLIPFVVALAIGFARGVNTGIHGTSSGSDTAGQIQDVMGQSMPGVMVRCPSEIQRGKGSISDCTAQAPGEPAYVVRVTQDDDHGHFTWELTPQRAP
ncbi:MAG: hypothetical protein JWP11_495 [Frankiales bacterium]|nr:hypothetical protein [Frankiales bacterium]